MIERRLAGKTYLRTIPRAEGALEDLHKPLWMVSCMLQTSFEMRLTRGTSNQESSFSSLGKTKHVEGTHERGLECLDSVELVVGRGCGASKMIDF
jgi:hypothetical protein